jgi:uncharacterized protein (DUF433 family)
MSAFAPAAPSDWRETAGIPRRNCLDRLTPAELAIRAAIDAVEMVGADVLLTQTVVLLGQAADKLADYIDGTKPEPVYDVGQERDAAPPAAPSEPSSQLLVVCQPGRVGGKPTIGESRLTVGAVASFIRAGYDDERVAREYESSKLTAHDVSVVRALLGELRENPVDVASVNSDARAALEAENAGLRATMAKVAADLKRHAHDAVHVLPVSSDDRDEAVFLESCASELRFDSGCGAETTPGPSMHRGRWHPG